jgi:hypothetical protein
MYAVCVQWENANAVVRAVPVVGYLGSRDKRTTTRLGSMSWLMRTEDKRVFRTVYDHAKRSSMSSASDTHWFAIKADSELEARRHQDVLFVVSHVSHYQMTHAFRGIYFISNGQGEMKIGRTGSSLATRLAACQTGSPHELYVVAAVEDGDFVKKEKHLHRKYASIHLRGEWFAMNDQTAVQIAKSLGGREWIAESQKTPTEELLK